MKVNINKCCVMQLSKHHHKVNSYTQCQVKFSRSLNNIEELSLTTNCLGNCTSTIYVCGKAMKLIGFFNCNLHTCSKELKELSYKQSMLPILDYTSSIWDPYDQNQINNCKFEIRTVNREMFEVK